MHAEVNERIATYFAAWNEKDPDHRHELLARSVSTDVELVHPTSGRTVGIDLLAEHITRYQEAMPSTSVVLATEVDGHSGIARYGWRIVDASGAATMTGLDVVELADDGRLKRVLLFHGDLAAR